jgi:hypothetical protein
MSGKSKEKSSITFGSPAVFKSEDPAALRPSVTGGLPFSCDRCFCTSHKTTLCESNFRMSRKF